MYWLRNSKSYIISTYLQGGQGNLSGAIIKDITFKCPTIEEQTSIGKVIGELDTIITLHQQKSFSIDLFIIIFASKNKR